MNWKKSSRCANDEYCVEVSLGVHEHHVRDAKNIAGPHLTLSTPAWAAFISAIRTGDIS